MRVRRIHFEWKAKGKKAAGRCWNTPFWYGNGEPATEPSVVLRDSDYRKLLKDARAALTKAEPNEPSEDARDAARYRYLRDLAGNGIMRLLMKPSNPDQWDALIDHDLAQQPQTKVSSQP